MHTRDGFCWRTAMCCCMAVFLLGVIVLNADAALPERTLVYCSEGSPSGFDPGQTQSGVEYSASAETIYDRLVKLNLDTLRIQPSLATDWDISPDGRVYTFHLRRDVKFHTTPWFKPTRAFNAQDVLFTFERMLNPKMPFRTAYPTEFPYVHFTGIDTLIQNIEAPDPYTVRFTLKKANAPFLANLAIPPASILSAEYAANLLKADRPSDIDRKPVGTGPFFLKEYVQDAFIRFDGNPEYWKPNDVQVSQLLFAITPDAAVRAQKLKANECQISVYPRPADVAALKADPHLRVLSRPGFTFSYLAYNVTHKPLDDVQVRRALDMAIDKKAIINAVYAGHAQVAVAPMAPVQWSYDSTLKDTPRDLERAKALLAKAGYPNGLSLSLWAMPIQRFYNPNPRLMAEMIQADWKKIGVKAKIVTYEWGEYLKRSKRGEHDAMLIGGISDNGDPDNWLGTTLSCHAVGSANYAQWCNPAFDDLIQKAVQTTDVAQRSQLYIQAQKLFKREQPFTPIAYPTIYQPINRNVTGFKIHPFGLTVFHGVGLK